MADDPRNAEDYVDYGGLLSADEMPADFMTQYDRDRAEADRIEEEAEARWKMRAEYPNRELEEAKDRYWKVMGPINAEHDAEFHRAEKLRETAFQNMWAAHTASQREFNGFIQDLLSSPDEQTMIDKLNGRISEDVSDIEATE
jgi:hypothetical protein